MSRTVCDSSRVVRLRQGARHSLGPLSTGIPKEKSESLQGRT